MSEKIWLKYARAQRDNIRGYNKLAAQYPKQHAHYKDGARLALRRAVFYFLQVRIECERAAT